MKERWQSVWIALQFVLLCLAGTLAVDSISRAEILDTITAFAAQLIMFFTITSAMK